MIAHDEPRVNTTNDLWTLAKAGSLEDVETRPLRGRPRKAPKLSAKAAYAEHILTQTIPGRRDGLFRTDKTKKILFKWVGTHWKAEDLVDAAGAAFSWLRPNPDYYPILDRKLAEACVDTAMLVLPTIPESRASGHTVVPVENGTLSVDGGTATLRPSDPADGLTYEIACKYDPDAPAPIFEKFIAQILPDESVRNFLQEYVGYTLTPDTRHQIYTYWLGTGGNGKSTLAKVVQRLHGSVSMLNLELEGFEMTSLIGASLVLIDETGEKINERTLKNLIDGCGVSINRKFKDPIPYKSTAKWIIVGNLLPKTLKALDEGFWRRFVPIPFSKSFHESEERDLTVGEKILDLELAGVLSWAVRGLVRLNQRGKFPEIPDMIAKEKKRNREAFDTVRGWLSQTEATLAPQNTPEGGWAGSLAAYSAYRAHVELSGQKPVAAHGFWERVAQVFPSVVNKKAAVINAAGGRPQVTNLVWDGFLVKTRQGGNAHA